MRNLAVDPEEIKRLAKHRDDENWDLRSWIKARYDFNDERLMSVVRRLADEITPQIDCTQCANCCRTLALRLELGDLARLAQGLRMSVAEVQKTYLRPSEQGGWELPAPCPLLEGNLCRVYEHRPRECRDYPHLHADFREHSISRIEGASVCPIVFNVVEQMKRELRWPGLRRKWPRGSA